MKKALAVITFLVFMLSMLSLPASAEKPVYLFVTSGVDQTIDDALIERIKSLGFEVETITHDDLDAAAAAEAAKGKIAVYMSESVTSGNILDAFKDVPVPIVFSEPALIEDMGLCGPTDGVDFGSHTNHTNATVVKPDHPIVKGVSKDFTIVPEEGLSPAPTYCWHVVPEKNAIAVDPDAPDRAVIWAYEKGDTTVDGLHAPYQVPEKRAGINWHTTMPYDSVSEDMLKIFDNAIIWAAGIDPLAPPETEPVTEAPVTVEAPATVNTVSPKTADFMLVAVVFAAGAAAAALSQKKKK